MLPSCTARIATRPMRRRRRRGSRGCWTGARGRPLPSAGLPRRAGSTPPRSSPSSRPRAHHYGHKIFASSLLDDAFLHYGWPRMQNGSFVWVFYWSMFLGVGVRPRFWSLRVSRGSAGQPSNLRATGLPSPLLGPCLFASGRAPSLFSPARHSAKPRLSNRPVEQSSRFCARAPASADMAASHCGNVQGQEKASAPVADLYAVLGLSRECTDAELRVAYRRLAMIWHPDRCSAPGSSARVEEAKVRFQEIQGAYSVLSDSNKRLLYDVGVYDSEDDEADLSGMGDFLGEMADMMSQATPTETFEELQQVFVDMFQDDLDAGFFGGLPTGHRAQAPSTSSPPSVSSPPPLRPTPAGRNKGAQAPSSSSFKGVERQGSTAKRPRPGSAGLEPDLGLSGFCFMVSKSKERQAAWASDDGDNRSGSKERLSTSRDVSGGHAHGRARAEETCGSVWPLSLVD
ncbi:uncharacterized protein [Miscanthus floridulus]|uniref:uncharacterized protein n=1 Tax=Miscanthus floridulus TaxID=154761 RepID=UPI0034583668